MIVQQELTEGKKVIEMFVPFFEGKMNISESSAACVDSKGFVVFNAYNPEKNWFDEVKICKTAQELFTSLMDIFNANMNACKNRAEIKEEEIQEKSQFYEDEWKRLESDIDSISIDELIRERFKDIDLEKEINNTIVELSNPNPTEAEKQLYEKTGMYLVEKGTLNLVPPAEYYRYALCYDLTMPAEYPEKILITRKAIDYNQTVEFNPLTKWIELRGNFSAEALKVIEARVRELGWDKNE